MPPGAVTLRAPVVSWPIPIIKRETSRTAPERLPERAHLRPPDPTPYATGSAADGSGGLVGDTVDALLGIRL